MRDFLVFFLVVVSFGRCDSTLSTSSEDATEPTKFSAETDCVDPTRCCAPEKLRCTGDPDRSIICVCTDLWDCSENLAKCEMPLEEPDGAGDWSCAWTDVAFVCRRSGEQENPPQGGAQWHCRWVAEQSSWECTASPPTPSGPADGSGQWSCRIELELGAIVCEQVGSEDLPFEEEEEPTVEPPPEPPIATDSSCVVGQRMWCEGSDFCGWGLVDCDVETGTWRTKQVDGAEVLDCRNVADGRRPDTLCACYHYSFAAECCEEADCLVEANSDGTYGRLCPANEGKLCDYCDPVVESSCIEPGGMCLMVKSKESFCVRGCSASTPCPTGYKCIDVTTPAGTTKQCVPEDMSCYE